MCEHLRFTCVCMHISSIYKYRFVRTSTVPKYVHKFFRATGRQRRVKSQPAQKKHLHLMSLGSSERVYLSLLPWMEQDPFLSSEPLSAFRASGSV